MMRASLWLLMVASLAFNAGVLLTLGVRAAREVVTGQSPPPETPPKDFGRPFDGPPFGGEPGRVLRRERMLLRTRIDALRNELRVQSEALAELIVEGHGDTEAATAQLDRVMDVRREMLVAVVEHLERIRDVVGVQRPEAFKRLARQVLAQSDGTRPQPPNDADRKSGRFPGRGPGFEGGRFPGKRFGPDAERGPGAFTPKSAPGRERKRDKQSNDNGADRDRSENK